MAWNFEYGGFEKAYFIAFDRFKKESISLEPDEVKTIITSLKKDGYILEHSSNVRLTNDGKRFLKPELWEMVVDYLL